jgi:hypothetical protein
MSLQVIYNSSNFRPCNFFVKNSHKNSESIEKKLEAKNLNLSRNIFLRTISGFFGAVSVFGGMAGKQIITLI